MFSFLFYLFRFKINFDLKLHQSWTYLKQLRITVGKYILFAMYLKNYVYSVITLFLIRTI